MKSPLLPALVGFANAEFDGSSVNGAPLMATLQKLTIDEVYSQQTFEGYTAQEIVSHLAFCKHMVAVAVLGTEVVAPYPYPIGYEGLAALPQPTPEAWTELLDYLRHIHPLAMQAVERIVAGGGPPTIERWNFASLDAAVWLCSHDTYHLAQIRSMGIASLRGRKLS